MCIFDQKNNIFNNTKHIVEINLHKILIEIGLKTNKIIFGKMREKFGINSIF